MNKLTLLKSVFIFNGLDEKLIEHFARTVDTITIDENNALFHEGDSSDSFYIIDSGQVVIYKTLSTGSEKVLALLESGSVFGEMVFFSDIPRSANAKATQKTILLKISKKDFLETINAHPQQGLHILSRMLQIVMNRLARTSRELTTIYQTSRIISSGKNLKEIIKLAQEEITLAIPEATTVMSFLYNEFNQDYEFIGFDKDIQEIAESDPFISYIHNKPSGIIIDAIDQEKVLDKPFLKSARSLLMVPLLKDDTLLGFFILLTTKSDRVFENSHLLLILSVATQLVEAINNIRHQQEERDRRRLLEAKQTY